jgi:sec-independent protein translocase protein TatC
MNFFKELEELKKTVLSILLVFLIFMLFFFLIGLKEVTFLGKEILIPFPQLDSFSAGIFKKMQQDLVPQGTRLIVTGPLSAFSVQIFISACLALLTGFPYFLHKIIVYLTPVLSEKERKKVLGAWIPSVCLFLAGCVFSYVFLVPVTLDILYKYPKALEAISFLNIGEFVFFSMGLIIVVGIAFLLPVFMILLSSLGLVSKNFWKKNWRYAIIVFLIFSAIITPDGSGLTMIFLSLPMSGLYVLGFILSPK